MRKISVFMVAASMITTLSFAQSFHPDSITVLEETVYKNDTLPFVKMAEIHIYSLAFANSYEEAKFKKYKHKVEKVYPYAMMAKEILADIDEQKEMSKKKRQVKRYTKDKEKDLRSQFEEELKNLTVSEGKILVQLINRETGNNCYRLIRELKGGISAFFWQKVARNYGYNLKEYYDPGAPENFNLEYIVSEIEGNMAQFYEIGG